LSATQGRDFFGRCALTSKPRHPHEQSLAAYTCLRAPSRCVYVNGRVCVCVCGGQRKRKSNLQQLPTHVSLSTLFKLGEKPQAMLLSASLSVQSDSLGKDARARRGRRKTGGRRSAHGHRGSNFPLRSPSQIDYLHTAHTPYFLLGIRSEVTLSLYALEKDTKEPSKEREKLDQ
jgi:hypothetical protein